MFLRKFSFLLVLILVINVTASSSDKLELAGTEQVRKSEDGAAELLEMFEKGFESALETMTNISWQPLKSEYQTEQIRYAYENHVSDGFRTVNPTGSRPAVQSSCAEDISAVISGYIKLNNTNVIIIINGLNNNNGHTESTTFKTTIPTTSTSAPVTKPDLCSTEISTSKTTLSPMTIVPSSSSTTPIAVSTSGCVGETTATTTLKSTSDATSSSTQTTSTDSPTLPNNCPKSKTGITSCQQVDTKGPYTVLLPDCSNITVYCTIDKYDENWAQIQLRTSDELNFAMNWYKSKSVEGLSIPLVNYWAGLETLRKLTESRPLPVKFIVEQVHSVQVAEYSHFQIGDEFSRYAITSLGSFSGNLVVRRGVAFLSVGMKFTTWDLDNDNVPGQNCASQNGGAWWYGSVCNSNPNEWYVPGMKTSILLKW